MRGRKLCYSYKKIMEISAATPIQVNTDPTSLALKRR